MASNLFTNIRNSKLH
uniref:Uncharacterized protein n=1 Tax=Arundo donax TaxID=35708 RepID=A0A0A9C1R7_ARUDO